MSEEWRDQLVPCVTIWQIMLVGRRRWKSVCVLWQKLL